MNIRNSATPDETDFNTIQGSIPSCIPRGWYQNTCTTTTHSYTVKDTLFVSYFQDKHDVD